MLRRAVVDLLLDQCSGRVGRNVGQEFADVRESGGVRAGRRRKGGLSDGFDPGRIHPDVGDAHAARAGSLLRIELQHPAARDVESYILRYVVVVDFHLPDYLPVRLDRQPAGTSVAVGIVYGADGEGQGRILALQVEVRPSGAGARYGHVHVHVEAAVILTPVYLHRSLPALRRDGGHPEVLVI